MASKYPRGSQSLRSTKTIASANIGQSFPSATNSLSMIECVGTSPIKTIIQAEGNEARDAKGTIHAVSASSRVSARHAELEELRSKKLAKNLSKEISTGPQEVPFSTSELFHFFLQQKKQGNEWRQKKDDAIESLHRYRSNEDPSRSKEKHRQGGKYSVGTYTTTVSESGSISQEEKSIHEQRRKYHHDCIDYSHSYGPNLVTDDTHSEKGSGIELSDAAYSEIYRIEAVPTFNTALQCLHEEPVEVIAYPLFKSPVVRRSSDEIPKDGAVINAIPICLSDILQMEESTESTDIDVATIKRSNNTIFSSNFAKENADETGNSKYEHKPQDPTALEKLQVSINVLVGKDTRGGSKMKSSDQHDMIDQDATKPIVEASLKNNFMPSDDFPLFKDDEESNQVKFSGNNQTEQSGVDDEDARNESDEHHVKEFNDDKEDATIGSSDINNQNCYIEDTNEQSTVDLRELTLSFLMKERSNMEKVQIGTIKKLRTFRAGSDLLACLPMEQTEACSDTSASTISSQALQVSMSTSTLSKQKDEIVHFSRKEMGMNMIENNSISPDLLNQSPNNSTHCANGGEQVPERESSFDFTSASIPTPKNKHVKVATYHKESRRNRGEIPGLLLSAGTYRGHDRSKFKSGSSSQANMQAQLRIPQNNDSPSNKENAPGDRRLSSSLSPSKWNTQRRICDSRWMPDVHSSKGACERCIELVTKEERNVWVTTGHHYRVMCVRGGCSRSCLVFPRQETDSPVRLCHKCFYDTHPLSRENGSQSLRFKCDMN